MQQRIALTAMDFSTHQKQATHSFHDGIPHTICFNLPMVNQPLQAIAAKTLGKWGLRYVDHMVSTRTPDAWFHDLVQSGCDQGGFWCDTMIFGKTEIRSFETRRKNPSMNIRVILRKKGRETSAHLFITIFDMKREHTREYLELVHLFSPLMPSPLSIKSLMRPLVGRISFGDAGYLRCGSMVFGIFQVLFNEPRPIHISKFMMGKKDDVWTLDMSKEVECTLKGARPVKEVIKTSKGTVNVTRPATRDEVRQQRKEAKKVRRDRLQSRIERQKEDIENLKAQLDAAQKACNQVTESNRATARQKNRELEELQKKLERLKSSKESALAQKDAEIEEIQTLANEIIASEDATKQELQNADWQIQNLNAQVKGLKRRQSGAGLIAAPRQEQEKFAGEFEIALMSAIHFAMDNAPLKANSHSLRCRDIWKAFIQANPLAEKAFRNYKADASTLLSSIRKNDFWKNLFLLSPLGMTCSRHSNNHGKIRFADGDERYASVMSSTPSDTQSGPSNSADDLRHAFMYPV